MAELTQKQQAFVTGKLSGLPHKAAVIAAGYSPVGADQTATKLMQHPKVKAALRAGRSGANARRRGKGMPDLDHAWEVERDMELDGIGESDMLPKGKMPKDVYDDPRDFLRDTMNLQTLPHAVRMKAAEQLMPYEHAKVGEKGKKVTAKERAAQIAEGAAPEERATGTHNVTPFRSKSPPGSAR